jgi:signal transduction histidine kinase
MHIELARTEVEDPRLRTHLDTAKDLTRRAVEQLRSAIYALHHGEGEADEDLPSMLRRLSGVHMPDELRVEVRIGGKPVPLSPDCEQSLFRIAGEALFNTAVHADASRAVVRLAYTSGRVRLTICDDGSGRPEEVRRSLRAASVACPSGEHRGLVNMAARARELDGTLTFRRARLGGLQVQVDIPTPCATSAARQTAAGTRVTGR